MITTSPLAMPGDERRRFLAGVHVGVVGVARGAEEGPLLSPVWYRYEPGGAVVFVTAAGSEKAERLRVAGVASFLVQDEAPPQRFVAVEGPVRIEDRPDADLRRAIAARYLPADAVDDFLAMTPADALVAVHLTPGRWRSTDFGRLPPP